MSILEKIAITNPTTPIWIGGDLNLPNIDWSMHGYSFQQLLSLGALQYCSRLHC